LSVMLNIGGILAMAVVISSFVVFASIGSDSIYELMETPNN